MAIRGFELGTETDRMFADQERMRREREAGKTEQFAQVEQMIAEGAKPITIKDIGYFGLSVAPVTGDVIAFKDAPEDYERAYELIQAGYGERDLIKLGLGSAYSGLITLGLIPGIGFISRIGKSALKQLAIDSIKKGDNAKGAEILFNTSDFVKKEMGDKLNKNFSTKRQSEIKKIKEQYSGKAKTEMLKKLSNPTKKEIVFHGTAMGQYTKNPKLGMYADNDYLATELAQSYGDSSKIFMELVTDNNDNPIIDIATYGMKKTSDEIDKYAGTKLRFPIIAKDINGSPKVYSQEISLDVNKEAGEVYLKGAKAARNNYEGDTIGVVKLAEVDNRTDFQKNGLFTNMGDDGALLEYEDIGFNLNEYMIRDDRSSLLKAFNSPNYASYDQVMKANLQKAFPSGKIKVERVENYVEQGEGAGLVIAPKDKQIKTYKEVDINEVKFVGGGEEREIILLDTPRANEKGAMVGEKQLLSYSISKNQSDKNLVDLREIEDVLTKKNKADIKELKSYDEKFIDKLTTKGFDKFEDERFPQFVDETSYVGMGTTRKTGAHSELGEKAVSGSFDPIMSSSPAFTTPGEYGGFSDLGVGSDPMGRTIENLVYTEIPYNKFKNMTPEDYEQIVNLYKDDPKLRIQLLNKYKGEFVTSKGEGAKLPKSIHTEAEVAMFSPELKTFKKVTDDPKMLERVTKGNEAFDKMKDIEMKIAGIDSAKLTGNRVEQQKAYNTIRDYMNAGIDMGKYTGTYGARGSYDVFLQQNIMDGMKFNSLISQLAIQLPKGQKKRNMRILSRILDNKFETTTGAVSRVRPTYEQIAEGIAEKDFSAKKVINDLGNTLDKVKDNLVDFKNETGYIEKLSPRQIKELIMEITPKLNRGGLMTR